MSVDDVEKYVDQVFLLASKNLDSIGLPLSHKLADCVCRKLKGCHTDNVRKMNPR